MKPLTVFDPFELNHALNGFNLEDVKLLCEGTVVHEGDTIVYYLSLIAAFKLFVLFDTTVLMHDW